jgi:hypothetical protein
VVPGGPLLTTPYNLIENKDLSTGASVDSKAKDASASALGQGVSSITQDAVSPAQADYAVRNLGGGPGQIAQAVSNTLSGQGSYQAGTPQGLPIVGPLVSRFVGSSTGQGLQDARRQNDQLQKALVAAGMPREVGISPVGPTANTVQLTTAEETRYQQLTNQLIEQIVREQLADKDFATRPRDEQVKIMQRAISVARKSATGQMLDQIGNDEIDRREAAATAAKARQMGSAPAVPAYAGPTVGPTPTPPWNIPAYRGPAATPTP